MDTTHTWFRRVTLTLLTVAMIAMFLPFAVSLYEANTESFARDAAGKRAVLPQRDVQQVEARVNELTSSVREVDPADFRTYFAVLLELDKLDAGIDVLKADNGFDRRHDVLKQRVNGIRHSLVNSVQPVFIRREDTPAVMQSAAFKEAQDSSEAFRREVAAATPPGKYPWSSLATQLAYGWLAMLVFAVPFSLMMIKEATYAPWGAVLLSFLSERRPWIALASGPAGWLSVPYLFDDERVKVDVRFLGYGLLSALSCFIGGGVGVVKAQSSTPSPEKTTKSKKWKASVLQRFEQDVDAGALPVSTTDVTWVRDDG